MIGGILVAAASQLAAERLARLWARLACRALPWRSEAPQGGSAWLSGSTMRWHTSPALAATQDRVDAHSARVAVLILQFLPDAPADLLRAAITHDLGENAVGDLSCPVKRRDPELAARAAAHEREELARMGFACPGLRSDHLALLRLCDGLDAYLWALDHRPDLVARRSDWRRMFRELRRLAHGLGLRPKFDEIVKGVRDGKF